MMTRSVAGALAASLLTFIVCYAGEAFAADGQPRRGTRAFDDAKFENPEAWVLKERAARGGPGGTDWDTPYRSLIQTSTKAESKGFPPHDEAVRMIVADAQRSTENLEEHLYWTLFTNTSRPGIGPTRVLRPCASFTQRSLISSTGSR